MGASLDGTMMSVRERISLVLSESAKEEEDAKSEKNSSAAVPNPFILPSTTLKENNGGSGSKGGSAGVSTDPEPSDLDGGPSLEGVNLGGFTITALQQMLRQHLLIINSLGDQLRRETSKVQSVTCEKDKLESQLRSKQREDASLRSRYAILEEEKRKAEDLIKEQADKIEELQRQLDIVNTPKPVAEKYTCITPPPPVPPPCSPPGPSKPPNTDNDHGGLSDIFSVPPDKSTPPNRRHENCNVPSSFAPFHHRRSDSPPQLSPAVTPRSLPLSKYDPPIRRNNDVSDIYNLNDESGDEFEDELRPLTDPPQYEPSKPNPSLCLQSSPQQSPGFESSSHSDYTAHRSDGETRKRRLDPDSSCNDSNPAPPKRPSFFARPALAHQRYNRYMHPEARRRFTVNSVFARSRISEACKKPIGNLFNLRKSLSGGNDGSNPSGGTPTRQPPQLISIRNNNFLNVTRPIPRKSVAVGSSSNNVQQDIGLNYISQLTRSLDDDDDGDNAEGELNKSEKLAVADESTVSEVKKRTPGRPPGSTQIPHRLPGPSSSSPGPSSLPQSRLPNGIGEQRFSQRGRLLKPNRARYSPDLDIFPNPKDKCLTTKKNYFVTDPLVQGELCAPEEEDKTETNVEVEVEEEEPPCLPEDMVEVPKWRISIVEGYNENEERPFLLDDDMSDEAFMKRHQKLEAKEKQRKRWDSQRMREESYLERLKRKQEERERQKELRRLRKRRGRSGCTSDDEQEPILPRLEDIKAIHVSRELPVGAFGFSLPLVEKVDFQLLWNPNTSCSIDIDSDSIRKSDSGEAICATMNTTTVQPPSPSPKSSTSSSSSLPSIPSPPPVSLEQQHIRSIGNIPIGTSIFRDSITTTHDEDSVFENDDDDDISDIVNIDLTKEDADDVNTIVNPSPFDVTTTITIAEEGELDFTSRSPIFTINLVDFRSEHNDTDSNGSSDQSNSGGGSDSDCSTRSSSPDSLPPSIPLETCPPSSELEPENVRTESVSTSNSVDMVEKIAKAVSPTVSTFHISIPANPLAPRHSHPPPLNSSANPGNKASPARTNSLSDVSKDNVRS